MNTFIKNLERMFDVSCANIRDMICDFHSEMKRGLLGQKSSLKMLPSFVKRPKGTEKGRYLALDLGGTNLRILAAQLNGNGKVTILSVDRFVVEKRLMCGKGDALFDFMAQCIIDFLRKNKINTGTGLSLAFTFSFPLEQTGIASGRLISWTKGFSASGVVGQDVVVLLKKALAHKGMTSIKIVALVNDAVGTLVSKSYSDQLCDVGVILGTGTNACYLENDDEMIINIEWGNFTKLHQTPYDVELDKNSPNAGFHFLEKMVSGMYLGELVRRIILKMVQEELIFKNISHKAFRNEHSFKTEHMALIALGNFDALKDFEIHNISVNDKKILKRICHIISLRSARLAGMAIAAVVTWMDPELKKNHLIGIDGSLFECYPGYKESLLGVFKEIFGKRAPKINLEMAKDGSGIGAAIIAATIPSRCNHLSRC